jgi:hypothetical protein
VIPPFLISIGINLLIGLVAAGAQSMLANMTKKPAPKNKSSGSRSIQQTGGSVPLSFIIGRRGTAGYLEYVGTWGETDDVKNAYLTHVISVSDLPVRGLNRFFVDGKAVTLGAHSSKGYAVTEYEKGGKDHMWIEFFDGTQTTADALLLDKFGSRPNRPWESDMIGRGIAYARITALYNPNLFNRTPDESFYFFEVDGVEMDDTRGDDAQTNPVVAIHQTLSGFYYGDIWIWGVQNLPATRKPETNFEPQADKCDVLTAKKGGGTEKRFQFGAEIYVNEQPVDVITELLETCNGRMAAPGGIYKILVAEPDAVVKIFTDEDFVNTEQQNFDPFPGIEGVYNTVEASYIEPNQGWTLKALPARAKADYIEADGQERSVGITLDYVWSGTQGQRLQSALLEESRRLRAHSGTMPPEWYEFEVLETVSWTSVRNGYINKTFLITVMDDMPNSNQFIGLKEEDPDEYDYDAEVDEITSIIAQLYLDPPDPVPIPDFDADPYIFPDSGGGNRRIGVEVFYPGERVDVRAVQIQITEAFGSNNVVLDTGEITYDVTETGLISRPLTWAGIIPNEDYVVQGKFLTHSGIDGEWSTPIPVTTPNVGLVAGDITEVSATTIIGQIIASQIANDAIIADKLATDAVTSIKIAAGAVQAAELAVAAVTAAAIDTGAVIATKIADGAVESAKLANDAVTAVKLANLAVDTAAIQVAAITTSVMAAGAVTSTIIADDSVTTAKILAGTIVAGDIASGTITTTQIAAGTIVASDIAAGTITGNEIAAATITGDKIVANTITVRELIVTDFYNAILNPDFAGGSNAGWAGGTMVMGQSSSLDGHPWYARVTATGTTLDTYAELAVPVVPAEVWYLECWVNGSAASGTVALFLRQNDADGVLVSTGVQSAVSLTTSWQKLTETVTIAATSRIAFRAGLRLNSSVAVGTNVFMTGFRLRKMANADLIVDGTITAVKIVAGTITSSQIASNTITSGNILAGTIAASDIAAGTITGTQIAATTITGAHIVSNTITAKQLILTDFSNIFPDMRLLDENDWTFSDIAGATTGWLFRDNGQSSGLRSVAWSTTSISPAASIATAIYPDLVPCEPNTEYAFGGIIDWTGISGALSAYFRLYWFDLAGASITSDIGTASASTAATTLSNIATSPVNAAYMRLQLRVTTAGGAIAGTVDFRNMFIRRAMAATLIVDGSIIAGKINAGAINTSSLMVDGVVVTAKILDNAVTSIYAGGTDTEIAANASTTYKTIATVSNVVVPATSSVHLAFTSSGEFGNAATNQFRILRDASQIKEFYGSFIDGGSGGAEAYRWQSSYVLVDSLPGAGTYDYVVQVRSLQPGGASSLATRWKYTRAVATVFKK